MITFIDILGYFIAYVFICVILNVLQTVIRLQLDKTDLHLPKIKWPKSRKYTGKESPIYEVFKDRTGKYYIRKWKLDWHGDLNIVSCFLFPILCEWFTWEYVDCGEYFLCESTSELEDYTESQIENIWETKYAEAVDEHNVWLSERTSEEEQLNKLNEKFNRNWV